MFIGEHVLFGKNYLAYVKTDLCPYFCRPWFTHPYRGRHTRLTHCSVTTSKSMPSISLLGEDSYTGRPSIPVLDFAFKKRDRDVQA